MIFQGEGQRAQCQPEKEVIISLLILELNVKHAETEARLHERTRRFLLSSRAGLVEGGSFDRQLSEVNLSRIAVFRGAGDYERPIGGGSVTC